MSQDETQIPIDDQTLQRAIRAAWGPGTASPDLRRRVQMAMTRAVLEDPAIPESTRSPRFWDRWPKPARLAAGIAALLLLAVGSTWGIMELQDTATRRAIAAAPHVDLATPRAVPTLYAMLVARHDDFSAGAEAPSGDDGTVPPNTDLTQLRNTLSAQLHHPLWAPDLAKLGWRLTSVRVYPINGVSAVAFHFTRGPSDSLTAFSLPAAPADPGECVGDIPDFDAVLADRSVSSFSTAGQLFAVVASRGASPLPQADVRALVTQFRSDPACISSAACH